MGFLAALLPGVRELRVPLAVGIAWSTLFIIAFSENTPTFVEYVVDAISRLPDTFLLALALSTVYVGGVLAIGIVDSAAKFLVRFRPFNHFKDVAGRISEGAERTVRQSLVERLRPLSKTIAPLAAPGIVMVEFPLAAMKLSSEAPEQYHQYDRLVSEAEFRIHMSLPILAIGLLTAFNVAEGSPLVLLVLLAASLLITTQLASQGAIQARRAMELLASAIYFQLTTTPLLETMLEELKELETDAEGRLPDPLHLAWYVEFLCARNLLAVHWQQASVPFITAVDEDGKGLYKDYFGQFNVPLVEEVIQHLDYDCQAQLAEQLNRPLSRVYEVIRNYHLAKY